VSSLLRLVHINIRSIKVGMRWYFRKDIERWTGRSAGVRFVVLQRHNQGYLQGQSCCRIALNNSGSRSPRSSQLSNS
jgi:hypothetical protein